MKRGNRLDSIHNRMSFVLISFCILGFGVLTKAQTQSPDRLRCFELGENGRQKKCSGDYSLYEGPVYLRAQRIQIDRLLNSRSLNDVASIKAYVRSLDTFAKRNPNRARILANVLYPNQETYPIPRDAPRYWKEFPTRKARASEQNFNEAYDGAQVWTRNGKVVLVQIAPNQNQSGDERIITYYFREDGSLAKTRFKFYDYGVDGDVVKEVIYDAKGKVLDTRMQCVQTNDLPRPRIVNCSRISSAITDDAPPVYKKVEELPFNDLLNEQS